MILNYLSPDLWTSRQRGDAEMPAARTAAIQGLPRLAATEDVRELAAEIRQTRDDLAHETGYDLQRLFNYAREREREAAARGVKFISPAPREKETACALREEPPKQK